VGRITLHGNDVAIVKINQLSTDFLTLTFSSKAEPRNIKRKTGSETSHAPNRLNKAIFEKIR